MNFCFGAAASRNPGLAITLRLSLCTVDRSANQGERCAVHPAAWRCKPGEALWHRALPLRRDVVLQCSNCAGAGGSRAGGALPPAPAAALQLATACPATPRSTHTPLMPPYLLHRPCHAPIGAHPVARAQDHHSLGRPQLGACGGRPPAARGLLRVCGRAEDPGARHLLRHAGGRGTTSLLFLFFFGMAVAAAPGCKGRTHN